MLEKLLEKQDYKSYGILQKEVEELMIKLEKMIELKAGEIASPTNDINLTAALAILAVICYLVAGMLKKGPFKYLKTFFTPMGLLEVLEGELTIDNHVKTKYQIWLDISNSEWVKSDTGPLYNAWVFQKDFDNKDYHRAIGIDVKVNNYESWYLNTTNNSILVSVDTHIENTNKLLTNISETIDQVFKDNIEMEIKIKLTKEEYEEGHIVDAININFIIGFCYFILGKN